MKATPYLRISLCLLIATFFLGSGGIETAEALEFSISARRDPHGFARNMRPRHMDEPIFHHGMRYRYRHGTFYRQTLFGLTIVHAPVGAVVKTLPKEHKTVVIDGVMYHCYDGVYYKGGPAGYTVVEVDPHPNALKIATDNPITESSIAGVETINIPNKNGSYTPVQLQKLENGTYRGPQGEVYPTHPELGQLQAMYGK